MSTGQSDDRKLKKVLRKSVKESWITRLISKIYMENNAKIAGRYFDQKLGVLEEGAAADVIIVNYNPLTPMNENNINGHLVFGVTGHDVVTTVANGKVLMKDRRLTEIDEAKVMADCRQAAAELGKRINSR